MGIKVNDVDPRVQYVPIAAQVVFTIPFEFFEDADIKIYFGDNTVAESSGFTIVGANSNGTKEVTFAVAPDTNGVTKLTIERDTQVKRTTNFTVSADWTPDNINNEYNRITMMVGEREGEIQRGVTRPVQSSETYSLDWPDGAESSTRFLGVTTSGLSLITAASLGAVVISDANPLVAGTVDPGTSDEVSRTDHVHPSAKDVVEELTGKIMDDDSNTVHAVVTYQKIRNMSGMPLPAGSPYYITGYNSGTDRVTVDVADADDPAKMPSPGIIEEDIANNANGHGVKAGLVGNIDTSSFSVNDQLYISTTGTLTATKPTGAAEQVQAIATVLRSHATLGMIDVQGAGRSNDIPNSLHVKGADIVTADPLVIPNNGGYFDVTAANAIASMTVTDGKFFILQFDSTPTITVGAGITLNNAAGNYTAAAGDIIICQAVATNTVVGTVIKADGTAVAGAGGFTLATPQSTTSGTSVTFGSVPSGTTMIVINFKGVSWTANVEGDITIGDAGGLETSGYVASSVALSAGSPVEAASQTSAFIIDNNIAGGMILNGTVTLTLENVANNTWVASGNVATSTTNDSSVGGEKSLSAELTQVSIGGGTFDAGEINIMYV